LNCILRIYVPPCSQTEVNSRILETFAGRVSSQLNPETLNSVDSAAEIVACGEVEKFKTEVGEVRVHS
jgi:hypothetical protein